jgi:hypothetical protein
MKHSLNDHAGYFIIDHTDSPGIRAEEVPPRLRNSTVAVAAGQKFETDLHTCSHCQRGVFPNPNRKRPRALCPYCYHYICDECDRVRKVTGKCNPIKKLLEESKPRSNEPLIVLTDN